MDAFQRYFATYGREIAMSIGRDCRMDANESLAFVRSLEYVYSRTYDAVYPDLKARSMIPVNTEGGMAETFIYRGTQLIGQADWQSDLATDFPIVGLASAEQSGIYQTFGDGYMFSDDQVARAALLGVPMPLKLAMAARMACDRFLDNVAVNGGPGLKGFATSAEVTVLNKSSTPALTGDWDAATTGAQIQADVDKATAFLLQRSQGVILPGSLTLALPLKAYTGLLTKQFSIYESRNMVQFLTETGRVKEIVPWVPLTQVTGSTGNAERGVLYQKDPDVVELLIPQDFTQAEPQRQGFVTKVFCKVRTGGVDWHRPDRAVYMDEINT